MGEWPKTLYLCFECGGFDDSPLPHRHGQGLKKHTAQKLGITVVPADELESERDALRERVEALETALEEIAGAALPADAFGTIWNEHPATKFVRASARAALEGTDTHTGQ